MRIDQNFNGMYPRLLTIIMYENMFYIMTVSRATVRALVKNSVYITNYFYPQ